jgi:hypothetical protein
MKRGAGIVLIAAAVAALLLAGVASAAPSAKRNILVFAGNDKPKVVAAIHRLDCKKVKQGGHKKVLAKGKDKGWKLEVHINHFTGYHDYDVEYGIKQTNFELDPPGGGGFYSNIFFPGEQPPPLKGNLTFPSGKRKLGLFFPAAFSSSDKKNDAVGLAGQAKCSWG